MAVRIPLTVIVPTPVINPNAVRLPLDETVRAPSTDKGMMLKIVPLIVTLKKLVRGPEPLIDLAAPLNVHLPLVKLRVPLFVKLPVTNRLTFVEADTLPVIVTSLKVLFPPPVTSVVPAKVVVALDVNCPVPPRLPLIVMFMDEVAVEPPEDATLKIEVETGVPVTAVVPLRLNVPEV